MAIFKPKPVAPTPVIGKPVAPKPVAPTPVAPKPVIGKPVAPKPVVPTPVIGKPVMPGIKPLPPGSIGMPGGPGGKTVYNMGPMPGNVEQNYRGIPGLVNAVAPIGNIANRFTGGPAPMPIKGAPNTFAGAGFNNPNANANFAAAKSMIAGKPMPKSGPQQRIPIVDVRKIPGVGGMLGKSLGMKKGGTVSSASKRADGIAQRGKTRA